MQLTTSSILNLCKVFLFLLWLLHPFFPFLCLNFKGCCSSCFIFYSSFPLTGLGLVNVVSRMAIFYGQTGLLRVESGEGNGTSVYLTYLMREEGQDVFGIDRG